MGAETEKLVTEVDICNIALNNLGDAKISALDEDNQRARACNLRYVDVRNSVLRSHPWNCAVRRKALSGDSLSNSTDSWGYAYSYALPSDFLRLLKIKQSHYKYSLESGAILSDATPPLYIQYVWKNTNTTEYDSILVQAIGLRLAFEICAELTGKVELKSELYTRYQQTLAEARSVDATESTPEVIESNDLINSRVFSTHWAAFDDIPPESMVR